MYNIKKYTSLKSSGYEIVTPYDGDKPSYEGETHQCCHCGRHWQIKPGSGIQRGFCFKCNKLTCGCKTCDTCKPYGE